MVSASGNAITYSSCAVYFYEILNSLYFRAIVYYFLRSEENVRSVPLRSVIKEKMYAIHSLFTNGYFFCYFTIRGKVITPASLISSALDFSKGFSSTFVIGIELMLFRENRLHRRCKAAIKGDFDNKSRKRNVKIQRTPRNLEGAATLIPLASAMPCRLCDFIFPFFENPFFGFYYFGLPSFPFNIAGARSSKPVTFRAWTLPQKFPRCERRDA